MSIKRIEVLVSEDQKKILSPAVGIYVSMPKHGGYLKEGSAAGRLRILNTELELIIPRGISGFITDLAADSGEIKVDYGTPLFRLATGSLNDIEEKEKVKKTIAGEEVPHGTIPVRSPTEGIFYRKPSPDANFYVAEGDKVEEGSILGLVEVMKSFNPINYGGPGFPEEATIFRICTQDSVEVKPGQILFLVQE